MEEKANVENIDKIIADLGANYKDDKEVLEEILEEVSSIASHLSNNDNTEALFPYIKKAVKAEYLARGAEGLTSRNEGSVSSSFEDTIDKMRNNIIRNGLRRIK